MSVFSWSNDLIMMSLYLITAVLDLLGLNYVCENQKSINELAREIERLLDKACASLPAKAREMQRYATTSMLCQKIALQLKLLIIQRPYQKPGNSYRYSNKLTWPLILLIRSNPGTMRIVWKVRRSIATSIPTAGFTECSLWHCGK